MKRTTSMQCNIIESYSHIARFSTEKRFLFLKKRLIRRALLAVLALFVESFLPARAQNGTFYNADNELSSSFVNAIYQDHKGFIWVATRDGLNRYDGYRFRIYKKGMAGCENMRSNVINCVTQTKDNVLLVGMFGGAQLYMNDKFYNISLLDEYNNVTTDFVTCITENIDGSILIGTTANGIFRLKISKADLENIDKISLKAKQYNVLSHFKFQKGKKIEETSNVKKIYVAKDGTLFIVSEKKGLYMLGKGKMRHFFNSPDKKITVTNIIEDEQSNYYIATRNHGVFTMKNGQSEPQFISEIGKESVSSIFASKNGTIIVGLDGKGIMLYNPKTKTVVQNPYYHKDLNLSRSKVYSIVEDRNGNLWFGLLQRGVFKQPLETMKFNYLGHKQGGKNKIGDCCVQSVRFTTDNHLWIGTDMDGIYHLDQNKELLRHYASPSAPNTVLSIINDGKKLWTGSYLQGVGFINEGGEYTHLDGDFPKELSTFGMDIDHDGNLWIASMGQGIFKYSQKDGTTTVMKHDDARAATDSMANFLANGYINDITISKDGKRMYAGTTMGLCCYEISRKSWTAVFNRNVILFGNPVRCVKELTPLEILGRKKVSKGKKSGKENIENEVWFGTKDGLYIYGLQSHKLTRLTPNDGLSSDAVAAIQPDGKGAVWVSTMHGLNRIDALSKRVTHRYYVEDGLQGNEFSDGASDIAPDGTIAFGGVNGVTYFSPDTIKPSPWKAEIHLTDFLVNGHSVATGEKSGRYTISEQSSLSSDEFNLAAKDNSISLEFSTLTFDAPERIRYSYTINNGKWIELPAGTNKITLSNLSPDTYTFRIKAEKEGMVSEEKVIKIHIHAPWYATTLAYLIYIILIIGGIVYANDFRVRNQKEKMLANIDEMKRAHQIEMQESKIKFFMNISHEIRTPMTLIISPILSLLQSDNDPQRIALYTTIKRNSERILNLINQIMDLRKIEKDQMPMHPEPTEMIGFISETYQLFEQQAINKSISFTFTHEKENIMACIDRSNFDKILVNLLSNAFKYTKPGGEVDIKIEEENEMMTITVKDSGIGIPPENLPHIFDRFYSDTHIAKGEHFVHTGTGIGLDLTNQLVLLHNGSIKADNNSDGPGCHFTLTIPLGDIEESAENKEFSSSEEKLAAKNSQELSSKKEKSQEQNQEVEKGKEKHAEHETEQGKEHCKEQEKDREKVAKSSVASSLASGAESSTMSSAMSSAMSRKKSEQKAADVKEEPSKRLSNQHIVVVEDDEEVRNYLVNELSKSWKVISYTNGKEALAGILNNEPMLVISDIMMPVMDGITLCSKLKTNINANHVPVILLTAKDTEEDRMEGIGIGADAYITKPFNYEILRQTMLNLMATRNIMKNKYLGNESQEAELENIDLDSADQKLMKRIMTIVNKNISNSDLTVDDIAREVGLSRVHLYRKMKELTNQSPHQFIRNLRVKQAEKLMINKGCKISEVVYTCGFPNPAAFNTAFKNVFGMNPRDYLKMKERQRN